MLAWGIAVALLLARLVRAQLRFHREMRNALPLDPQRLPVDVPGLLARIGLKQPVRIVESSAVASPAIWGIIRPTLILPVGIAATLSANQLQWVLLHELAHVRRRDLAVSCFQRLVQIVHFANPAVWIANRVVNRLREFACDDLAMSLCEGSPADPGEAFLSIVRHAADNRRRQRLNLEGALGVFDSAARASCFQRMRRLLDAERRVRVHLGAGSLCLLVLAGGIALPQIRAAGDLGEEKGVSGEQEQTSARGSQAGTSPPPDGTKDEKTAESLARDVRSYEANLLAHGTEIGDIRRLRGQKNVRDLVLHGERISDDELRGLAGYTLRMLGFVRTNVRGPGLKHLNVSQMNTLQLIGPQATDLWLENLPEIPTLRSLNISGSRITDAGLKNLEKFPNLESLNVSVTQIGDAGMKHVARLSRLQGLTLKETQVSDEGLAALEAFPGLKNFSLASPNVRGPGLAHLVQGAANLEQLQFVGPHATDEWLRQVEPLRSVTWLELHSTSVTGEGLASISQWENLRNLFLNYNPITDAGVKHLADLYMLDNVELRDTKITDAAFKELRRALPDTSIVK
jgi:hypothetical protein